VAATITGRRRIGKSRLVAEHARRTGHRVEDPYTRFYLKYIRPHLREIGRGIYLNTTLKQLPSWDTICGLQFEALVGRSLIPAILDRLHLRGVPVQRLRG
jgi:hypothetical protein